MYVRVSKGLYEKNKSFFEKMGMNEFTFRGRNTMQVDLKKLKIATLRELLKVCESTPGAYGAKAAVVDLQTWISMLAGDGADGVKCRSLEQFQSLCSMMIFETKHRWLFEEDESGNFLPHFAASVHYYNGLRSESHPYVTIDLHSARLGLNEIEAASFYGIDVVGKTVAQALLDKGWLIENESLVQAYLKDIAYFEDIHGDVGAQVLVNGIGSTRVSSYEGDSERYWRGDSLQIGSTEAPDRAVIDIDHESDKEARQSRSLPSNEFWQKFKTHARHDVSEEHIDEDAEDDPDDVEAAACHSVPQHPVVAIYSFSKSRRLAVHVNCVRRYEYKSGIGDMLIIPEDQRSLVDMLVSDKTIFNDVVAGKSGGAIILCAGPPGMGKTLTAQVYSETSKRPLYSIQCSQLGIDVNELENLLHRVFARSKRWGAILLLDEADVYVRARGDDLIQNAIVGVFLRTLEYYDGVLFLTTNRSDLVDDAISSRCIARIDYTAPDRDLARKIWHGISRVSGHEMSDELIEQLLSEFPGVSGRDIKNLIKLGGIVARFRSEPISIEHLRFARKFKATSNASEQTE